MKIKNSQLDSFTVILLVFFIILVLITNLKNSSKKFGYDKIIGHWSIETFESLLSDIHPTDIIFDYDFYIVKFSNGGYIKNKPDVEIYNIKSKNKHTDKMETLLASIDPFIAGGQAFLYLTEEGEIRAEESLKQGSMKDEDWNVYILSHVGG
ncbi:hypothetical protein KFV02_00300 [Desulfohalobiaceae bacterium Ax17]|uniref:hypothetical protein n=1 Tax=Desulfovulcanus ferrireducens TaxID=2831190 RepID=UPI00207BC418|nr:hypothetical protein [Desulfovulcanus ferrireducens]MBT8762373.1 hypothetical protein [Desulfovulcanus ferrireducens]